MKQPKLIIKVAITLLLVLFFCTDAMADGQKVTLKMTNVNLRHVFRSIERQTTYRFSYRNAIIDDTKNVSINMTDVYVEDVLNKILPPKKLGYEIISQKSIVIFDLKTKSENNDVHKKKVSGIIKDENGEPLIGATVRVKGTGVGTSTDLDGRFSMDLLSENTVLEVTSVGYKKQDFFIGKKDNVDIRLEEDRQLLEEVVVVGYGTQKKINLTGAVTAVSGDDISRRPVADASILLQGQVPGLFINQSTGQPGEEGVTMRIRGQGTFSSAGSDPMVLINGVPGDISALDPSVIETVSVLKDASSAAIYGARAANGVILITTKQGTAGDVHLNYHYNIGFHKPSRLYDIVTNSAEYMELANKAWENSGIGKAYSQEDIELYRQNVGSIEYPSFDWQDYMFRTATVQNHNITLSGGSEKATYNVALNYLNQPGTMRGFEHEKYNATVSITAKINDRIRFGSYSNLNYTKIEQPRQGQADAYLSTLSQPPMMMPWLPDDGTGVTRWSYKAYSIDGHNKNMPAIIEEGVLRHDRNFDVNSQLWIEADITKKITWHTKGAARLKSYKYKDWRGEDVPVYYYHTGKKGSILDKGGNGLTVYDGRRFYLNLYSYLKYEDSFVDNSNNIKFMVGYNQEHEKYESLWGYRKDFPFPLQVLDAGATSNWSNGGTEENWAIQSFFGRFNYNYKERYLFEANMRYDGTSRISKEHRWGLFPSFSAGWRVTEEPFISNKNLAWLDNLKIRASWGQLGNQNIGLYPYQAMIASVTDYPFGNTEDDVITGYQQTAYANRKLKWETTTIANIGFDLNIFKHLTLTFDCYSKTTKDILRQSQVSETLGLSAPYVNDGTVRNNGMELSIDYGNRIYSGAFNGMRYNIGGYFDLFKNKLVKFGAEEISSYYIRREGLPYNEYYMLECIGVFSTQEEIETSPKQYNDRTLPGDLKYKDQNNDGVIDDNDRIVMSGRFPKFEYSINGGFNWKGIDLSFIGQGIHGVKHYTTGWGVVPFQQGSSPNKEYVKNMWTEDNPYDAKHPRIYYGDLGGSKNTRANSYFLKNASFFRLKNITIGYTLPSTIFSNTCISKVRCYFSGDNLLLITPYKGLDPEREDGNDATYPQNKIFSFGINVEF